MFQENAFVDGSLELQMQSTKIPASHVLALMPKGMRYQFLDEIREVDQTHIVASYRFREDEFFYPGHFPGRPTTPGTILLEAMCQCGMTAHSYYFLALEVGEERASQYCVLFTGSEVEWFEQVRPGTLVIMHSQPLAWRQRRIRARVKMFDELGTLIAEALVSGISVMGSSTPLSLNQPSSTSTREVNNFHPKGSSL
jgi:3-hydroxyacyl-[acyl-carrier-protein] dehydratase